MQSMSYCHAPAGKVVDLSEYRSRMAFRPAPLPELSPDWDTAPGGRAPLPRQSRQRRAHRAMMTQFFSSAAVLLTTFLVTVQFL